MPFVMHSDVGVDGGGGVATNAHDFLKNKLATFITSATHFPTLADRWTRSKADVVVGTDEHEIFLTPPSGLTAGDAPFMAFHTRDQRIFMFASDSFDTTTPAHDQPGGIRGAATASSPPTGAANYGTSDRHECNWLNVMGAGPYLGHYLFAPPNGAYCYAAIQCATRKWRHMWFGAMDKFAAFTGGGFSCGHYVDQGGSTFGGIDQPQLAINAYPGGSIASCTGERAAPCFRADGLRTGVSWWLSSAGIDLNTPNFGQKAFTRNVTGQNVHGTSVTLGRGAFVGGSLGSFGQTMWAMSPSVLSGYQPMIPIIVMAAVDFEGGARMAPIGKMPDVARVSMKYFTPGQQIPVGSDNWRVFPIVNSDVVNTLNDQEYSGYEGFAYRERT